MKYNKLIIMWGIIISLGSIILFYLGLNRINSGLISIEDSFIRHFANVGLLYIQISFILIIVFFILSIIFIIYLLNKGLRRK